jgi:hypothetical protein
MRSASQKIPEKVKYNLQIDAKIRSNIKLSAEQKAQNKEKEVP